MRISNTPAPPQTQDTDASIVSNTPSGDLGLLEFGTSTNVIEDLTRTLQRDVQEIEKASAKVSEELKSEEKIGNELRKTRAHAVTEARRLQETATENLEKLTVNQEILRRLEESMKMDIIPSNKENPQDGTRNTMQGEEKTNEEDMENLPPTTPTNHRGFSLKALRKEQHSTVLHVRNILDQVKASEEQRIYLIEEKNAFVQAAAETRERMQLEQLEDRLMQFQNQIEEANKVKDDEMKCTSSLSVNKHSVLKRLEAMEKELLALAAKGNEKQKAFLASKKQAEEQALRFEQELQQLDAEVAKIKADNASLIDRTARAEKELKEAQDRIKIRDENKKKREAIRAERLDLLAEKERVEAALAKAKDDVEAAKRDVLKNEGLANETEKLFEENNKIECEKVLQNRSEYDDLCQQTDKLKKWTENNKSDPKIIELEKELEAIKQEAKNIKTDFDCALQEEEEKNTKFEEHTRILDEHKFQVRKETEATKDDIAELKDKRDDQAKRLAELKLQYDQKGVNKTHSELYRKVTVLRLGAKLLKDTARTEEKIHDISSDPYGLDD